MEKLYKSDHAEVFDRALSFIIEENPHVGLYVTVNMCQLIANKQADFLFGEDLKFKSPSDNEASEEAMNAIVSRSRLPIELRTGEISGICTGGTVLKVRYSPGDNGEERGAYIESMPAYYYFPRLDSVNARRVEAAAMAYEYEREGGDGTTIKCLYKETHERGKITTETYSMSGSAVGDVIEGPDVTNTGYDGLLLFYIPNNRFGGEFWGLSDFKPIEKLQDELNYAVSQLGLSMNKYSDPLLVTPTGTMKTIQEIEQQRPKFPFHPLEFSTRILRGAWAMVNPNKRVFPVNAKVIEGDPASLGNLPRYEQPAADFNARLAQIERLQKLIMQISETNSGALGLEDTGIPESGRALRMRMMGPLAKIKRKMQFWHYVLEEAMYAARVLEYRNGMGPEPEKPAIIWPDGLPEDEREQVEIAVMMKDGGLASLKTAVAKAQQLEGESLDSEIDAIEEDKQKAREQTAADTNNFFPPEDE
jgi:hypothetical protein